MSGEPRAGELGVNGEKGERRKRRKRRRAPPKRRFGKVTAAILVIGGVVAAMLVAIVFVYPHTKGPGDGKPIQIEFLGNESTSGIAAELASKGLITEPRLFSIYAKIARLNPDLVAGSHLLTDDASPAEIVLALERKGFATKVKVTFPEGFTRFDMAKRLYEKRVCTEEAFLHASSDPALLRRLNIEGDSAEGYLFPATYDFPVDSDPVDIIVRQKTEFDRRFQAIEQSHQLGKVDLENSLNWSTRDIVTLASMIEKEAAIDEERPIIASVFLNRLRDPNFKRRVLQCDPTSAYGCLVAREQIKSCAGFTGKITHDLNMDPDNMYSTYIHEKLPPGPISNPGAKSLEAVLGPASTKYLYFVARGQSRHTFSETLEAHNQAVKPSP